MRASVTATAALTDHCAGEGWHQARPLSGMNNGPHITHTTPLRSAAQPCDSPGTHFKCLVGGSYAHQGAAAPDPIEQGARAQRRLPSWPGRKPWERQGSDPPCVCCRRASQCRLGSRPAAGLRRHSPRMAASGTQRRTSGLLYIPAAIVEAAIGAVGLDMAVRQAMAGEDAGEVSVADGEQHMASAAQASEAVASQSPHRKLLTPIPDLPAMTTDVLMGCSSRPNRKHYVLSPRMSPGESCCRRVACNACTRNCAAAFPGQAAEGTKKAELAASQCAVASLAQAPGCWHAQQP